MSDIVKKDHFDLIEKLAWEVSKNVIDHHKFVYSKIFENAPSSFSISLRNGIYNQIKSAIKCKTDNDILDWIESSEAHRKRMQHLKRLSKKAKLANGDTEKIKDILQELKKGNDHE